MEKKKKVLIIGVIGADVHAVGNKILYHAFTEAGFDVVNLGVMVSQEEYIAAALAPAEVVSVTLLDEGKSCRVIVPDSQLSLAIGKEGQNARLAAKLTGYKIDIKSDAEV